MGLWLAATPLVLASASAVRRHLLEAAGIPVEVRPASLDERAVEASAPGNNPSAVAALLAREKALRVTANLSGQLVVGADQTLALGNRRFDKPADRDAARAQLEALAGRTHELHAAVAVARDGQVLFEHSAVARLTMRSLSDAFLDRYLDAAGAAVTASVGAYQLEALGVHLFEHIEGDHFTILGLPLVPLLAYLRAEGSLA
ncbi:MAG: Maf family protein [Hyphomicrobiales bacterium]|nr:Maf family protein [Hyphomicrobiales bacterium]MBV8824586.1 Maf family protein [Hyphomicrobiales bacterium]